MSCLCSGARHVAAALVAVCGLAALTAQTPAPSASPAKPLRHLEYSFSVGVQGLQGYRFDAANGAGLQTVDRFGNVADPEGGSGTMLVDVMSIAQDGALVVRIAELVRGDVRPRQAYNLHRLRRHHRCLSLEALPERSGVGVARLSRAPLHR